MGEGESGKERSTRTMHVRVTRCPRRASWLDLRERVRERERESKVKKCGTRSEFPISCGLSLRCVSAQQSRHAPRERLAVPFCRFRICRRVRDRVTLLPVLIWLYPAFHGRLLLPPTLHATLCGRPRARDKSCAPIGVHHSGLPYNDIMRRSDNKRRTDPAMILR